MPPLERDDLLRRRWLDEYGSCRTPLSDLAHRASALGVEVRSEATLNTLREAAAFHQVVILFAHWKGPEIAQEDFEVSLASASGLFAERAAICSTPSCRWLRLHLGHGQRSQRGSQHSRWLPAFLRTESPPPSIREVLMEAIAREDNDDCVPSDGADVILESEITRASRRRDELDHAFKGLLRPGNRLELFDGLHSSEAVAGALSDQFCGVLDLATCTSTVLADFIGRATGNRIRTVQFPDVQQPLWAAKCIQVTIDLVAERGIAYQDARLLATTMMELAVSQNVRRR